MPSRGSASPPVVRRHPAATGPPSPRRRGRRPPGAEPALDAYLWIKRPGESDGECEGGPAAGQWWPEYALEPARGSGP
ncbi:glycoside hydrolase family 6 protein [Streptomyces sp. NPDC001910]|uniref:glycoside hydrolase family 6 protein n=1 Tax=Streptomyces sp. NPDC001910 TaxID=3154403 RepID=UPI00332C3E5F